MAVLRPLFRTVENGPIIFKGHSQGFIIRVFQSNQNLCSGRRWGKIKYSFWFRNILLHLSCLVQKRTSLKRVELPSRLTFFRKRDKLAISSYLVVRTDSQIPLGIERTMKMRPLCKMLVPRWMSVWEKMAFVNEAICRPDFVCEHHIEKFILICRPVN